MYFNLILSNFWKFLRSLQTQDREMSYSWSVMVSCPLRQYQGVDLWSSCLRSTICAFKWHRGLCHWTVCPSADQCFLKSIFSYGKHIRHFFQLFLSDSDGQDKRSPSAERSQGERQNATKQIAAKKKLPTIPGPDLDEYMNRSVAKQKSAATASAVLNAYGPYFLEYTLLAE